MSSSKKYLDSHPPPYSAPVNPQQSLSQARTNHLNHIVYSSILPQVHHRATLGIDRTTIALLPSTPSSEFSAHSSLPSYDSVDDNGRNEDDELPDFQQENPQVLGLASKIDNSVYPTHKTDEDDSNDAEMTQVQLEGQMNSPQFWTQQSVLDELQQLITIALDLDETIITSGKDYNQIDDDFDKVKSQNVYDRDEKTLNSSLSQTHADLDETPSTQLPERPPDPTNPPKPKGFMSLLASRLEKRLDAGEEEMRAAEVKARIQKSRRQPKPKQNHQQSQDQRQQESGEASDAHRRIKVKIGIEEICLRTLNAFGLYESVNREGCVVVRIFIML